MGADNIVYIYRIILTRNQDHHPNNNTGRNPYSLSVSLLASIEQSFTNIMHSLRLLRPANTTTSTSTTTTTHHCTQLLLSSSYQLRIWDISRFEEMNINEDGNGHSEDGNANGMKKGNHDDQVKRMNGDHLTIRRLDFSKMVNRMK